MVPSFLPNQIFPLALIQPGPASKVMMNLVTGVFVEGAQRIAREEKNQAAVSGGKMP